MLEILKKIGLPATVSAVIAALVTITPFLFQIDERYAKAGDVENQLHELRKQNEALLRELAQVVGFQAAMVQFVQEGRFPRSTPAPAPRPAVPLHPPIAAQPPAPAPAPVSPPPTTPSVVEKEISIEAPRNWKELNDGLIRQQQRIAIPVK
jgi:hypothetical protein